MVKTILVPLVNEKDKIVGYKEKIELHRIPVLLHRAISVVIFSPDGKQMLLQKRASTKITWPNFWSNTCCSHPFKNESNLHAAHRRLKEEMGFDTALKESFNFMYDAKYSKAWGEHELDHVFIGTYTGKIILNPDEASDYKWEDVEKISKSSSTFTPWFKIILEKYSSQFPSQLQ